MVVVPEPARAERIARAVAMAGHAPIVLENGERAIDRFVLEPADAIIVEYFLPGRDGAATVESIRWAPGGRQAHAILLAVEEPETAALATIGARIDTVATFVGDPPEGKLIEILRSLDRKPPNDPRAQRPGELPPAALSFLDRTTSILKEGGHDLFGNTEDESTVRGSASLARKILEAHRIQTAENAVAPRSSVRPDAPVPVPTPAPGSDETRLGKRPVAPVSARAVASPAEVADGVRLREAARTSASSADAVAGRFESTAFPALLVRLAEQRTTGALVCTAEDEPRRTVTGESPLKIVYFRSGVPVHVRSNLVDECLGQLLLRKKRIGAATLDESVRRMQLGHGLQGEILIDMGALSPLEVSETLAEQAREKLFDLFGWRRGEYRMTQAETPKEVAPLELALPEMVYEGVVAAMPATRLSDLLTPMMDRYVVPDAQKLARFVRVRLPVELKAVLARIDGTTTMRLLLAMGTKPAAIAQLVYSMYCLGAVRFEQDARKRVAEPPSSGARPAASSGNVPLSQSSGSLPAARGPGGRPEGLVPSSGGVSIPVSVEQPVSKDVRLSQSSPALAPASAPATPPSPSAPPKSADLLPAKPAALTQSWDDDSTTPQLDEDELRELSQSILKPGVKDLPRAAPVASPPPPPPPEPPPAAAPPPPSDAAIDRLFEAERHFRRGNRALERERYTEALAAFEQATALCPDEGEFVAYVAWARHCASPYVAEATERALEELARAATLAPALFVVSLLRARVLTHAGRTEEAREAYARVLALEPSSEEARVALDRLGAP